MKYEAYTLTHKNVEHDGRLVNLYAKKTFSDLESAKKYMNEELKNGHECSLRIKTNNNH